MLNLAFAQIAEIATLENLKNTVLPHLISGELRVRPAD
jgi:hypothetical protein